jgi:hypothetical protein
VSKLVPACSLSLATQGFTIVNVPQQDDLSSCGAFSCFFMRAALESTPPLNRTGAQLRVMLATQIYNYCVGRGHYYVLDTTVSDADMRLVRGNGYINSRVINFYAALLYHQQLDSDQQAGICIVDSGFVTRLLDVDIQGFPKFFRWLNNTLSQRSIPSAHKFIFPVNVAYTHWYIVVAAIKPKGGFSLLLMDSLYGDYLEHQRKVFCCLRAFLTAFTFTVSLFLLYIYISPYIHLFFSTAYMNKITMYFTGGGKDVAEENREHSSSLLALSLYFCVCVCVVCVCGIAV